MTEIEQQILCNQGMLLAAISVLLHESNSPLVSTVLEGINTNIEVTAKMLGLELDKE